MANCVIGLHGASPALIFITRVCIKRPLHLRAKTMPRLFTIPPFREHEINQMPAHFVNRQRALRVERVCWQMDIRLLSVAPFEEWEPLPGRAFQIRARAKM